MGRAAVWSLGLAPQTQGAQFWVTGSENSSRPLAPFLKHGAYGSHDNITRFVDQESPKIQSPQAANNSVSPVPAPWLSEAFKLLNPGPGHQADHDGKRLSVHSKAGEVGNP